MRNELRAEFISVQMNKPTSKTFKKSIRWICQEEFQVHCITETTLGKADAGSVSSAEASMQNTFKAIHMPKII